MEHLIKIADFILESFLHIWPYLLISIPLAVALKFSGASQIIQRVLSKKPLIAILLAAIVGAFSPFCSCGVVPVITSLLIGGIPLAPVMAFWIASPSMDPEIFFLSSATIGWELSVWRLLATLVISLFAGYFTHFALLKGFLSQDFLRTERAHALNFSALFQPVKRLFIPPSQPMVLQFNEGSTSPFQAATCTIAPEANSSGSCGIAPEKVITCGSPQPARLPRLHELVRESQKATLMVIKFMLLAFLVNALITFYVPQELISNILGGQGNFAVISAALIGIPAYTSNLTALPLVSGLLSLGMNPGAALAFLIAGPTTTLPAMVAVWGIVRKKIFFLYIAFPITGAILFGILFNIFH